MACQARSRSSARPTGGRRVRVGRARPQDARADPRHRSLSDRQHDEVVRLDRRLAARRQRRLSLDDSVEHWLPGSFQRRRDHGSPAAQSHQRAVQLHRSPVLRGGAARTPATWRPWQLVDSPSLIRRCSRPVRAGRTRTRTSRARADRRAGRTFPRPLQMAGPALEVYRRVIGPLGLWRTSFPLTNPDIPGPHPHGYLIAHHLSGACPRPRHDSLRPILGLDGGRDRLDARRRRRLPSRAVHRSAAGADSSASCRRPSRPDPGWITASACLANTNALWPRLGARRGEPSAVSTSLISPDGSRQAALMVTREGNTWTEQIGVDYSPRC